MCIRDRASVLQTVRRSEGGEVRWVLSQVRRRASASLCDRRCRPDDGRATSYKSIGRLERLLTVAGRGGDASFASDDKTCVITRSLESVYTVGERTSVSLLRKLVKSDWSTMPTDIQMPRDDKRVDASDEQVSRRGTFCRKFCTQIVVSSLIV